MSVFNKVSACINNEPIYWHINKNKQNINSLVVTKEEIENKLKEQSVIKKAIKTKKEVEVNKNIIFSSLQNAIVASSLIGGLLSDYDTNVNFSGKRQIAWIPAVKKIQKKVRKMLYIGFRINKSGFFEAIEIRDKAWLQTTAYFSNQGIAIEILNTVINIFYHFEKELRQYANITEKLILELKKQIPENTCIKESNMFSDHLVELLSLYTRKKVETKNIEFDKLVKKGIKKCQTV